MKMFFDVLVGLAHIGWYALVGVAAVLIVTEFVRVYGVLEVCQ
jgi:hypothetical protein